MGGASRIGLVERRVRLVVVLGLLAAAVFAIAPRGGSETFEGSGPTMSGSLKDGSFMAVGAAHFRNVSGHPITLVHAAPARTEHVSVSSIGINRPGTTNLGSAQDQPIVGAAEIPGFVVLPGDGEDAFYTITMQVRLDQDADAGAVVGMDVLYLDGAGVTTQRFSAEIVVCRWSGESPPPCPSG